MIKKFNYFLFSLLYPKPLWIAKPTKKEVTEVILNKKIYKIFSITNCRIYTDTIHTFGLIKNKNLIEGPSYQIVNNNFLDIKKNQILKIGTPRLNKKLKGPIFVMLTGGGGNNNYFHWLFDVLPRLKLINSFIKLRKIRYFLMPAIKHKFQIETLKILNIRNKCLPSNNYRHIFSDKIITTCHPYVFSKNSANDAKKIPLWISLWLKENFLKYKSKKKFFNKIFIDRKQKSNENRFISNNEEVKNFLKDKGFSSLYLEDYSFKEQVGIFNQANIIIGLHSAGFANLAFCRKGTKIIEILNDTTGDQIKNLALTNKLLYYRIVSQTKQKTKDQQGVFEVSLNQLKKKVNRII